MRIALYLLLCLLVGSCVSRKEIAYFQGMEALAAAQTAGEAPLEIRPNDLLSITVSAFNPEAARPFNLVIESRPSTTGGANFSGAEQQAYLVSADGTIEFPVLGTLEVAGLTGKELNALLETHLSNYLKDPIVTIRLLNFQISVLGEVAQPGTYRVTGERITLPAALGLAGDLTIYGERDNILVIRETEAGKQYAYLDLTDASVINSEYYYLRQNDVLYVEPNKAQRQSATFNRNSTVYISVASLLVSVLVLIFR
ncbi:MAG: sugar transporter [Flavobacteriaceae bacterium]|nr:sugar transporter [Flavobacteriaceae bacterium]